MTDDFIISKILDKQCFRVGPYLVPKKTYSKEAGFLVPVEDNRKAQINRNKTNPNNTGFEEYLRSRPKLKPVSELPVWTSIGDRTYYLCDYFFPSLGLVVELDSFTYHSRPEMIKKDKEKDLDLISRGFKVFRVRGFSKQGEAKEKAIEQLDKFIATLTPRKELFPIDYKKPLINYFRIKYKSALEILESKPFGGIDISKFILTESEWNICTPCLKELDILPG